MTTAVIPTYMSSGTCSANTTQQFFMVQNSTSTTITSSVFSGNPTVVFGVPSQQHQTQYAAQRYDPIAHLTKEQLAGLIEYRGGKALWKKQIRLPPKRAARAVTRHEPILPNWNDFRTVNGYELPQSKGDYVMPDGSTLHVDDSGNYHIEDRDAKTTYKANRVREFNPYINASDLLEAFIREVGQIDDVRQDEVLRLPIEAFINWIILQAAKRDGDSLKNLPTVESALPKPPPMQALPNPQKLFPRCASCGRFIRKAWAAAQISFCSPDHMGRQLARIGA